MKSTSVVSLIIILILTAFSCNRRAEPVETDDRFPDLSGPFLGQSLPDSIPTLFAPGVVSTGMFARDVAITPDGKYFFFMATRTKEIESEDWNYKTLTSLYNSSGNGNPDIYWMDAGFIRELREKALDK